MTATPVPLADPAAGTPGLRTLGVGAQQAAPGNVLQVSSSVSLRGASASGVVTREVFIDWMTNPGTGDVMKWRTALDDANAENDDLVLAARGQGDGTMTDFMYLRAFGTQPNQRIAVGLNMTPPVSGHVLQVTAWDGSDWDAIQVRVGPGTTGDAYVAHDAGGVPLFRVTHDGTMYVRGAMFAVPDPGAITYAPQTSGNSGLPFVSYRGAPDAAAGFDLLSFANDVVAQLVTTDGGGTVVKMQTFDTSLVLAPQFATVGALRLAQPPGSPTVDLMSVMNNAQTVKLGGFNKAGTFYTSIHAAPADADVAAGQMFLWFDQTSGAAKLMVKAKDAGGTVRTGSLALA